MFRVSLYKALLYIEIAAAVKAGALNLVHSEKYRSLDDYLIPKADWAARRDEYLQRAQLEGFADCRATLEGLDQELDACYGSGSSSAGEFHPCDRVTGGSRPPPVPTERGVRFLLRCTFGVPHHALRQVVHSTFAAIRSRFVSMVSLHPLFA